MIECVLFLLDPEPLTTVLMPAVDTSVIPIGAPICDDRTSPFKPDGSPHWGCRIAGCGPHANICWSDRLAGCFDGHGHDNGQCVWSTTLTCSSRWSCFKLWAGCDGAYKCDSPSWPGCGSGTCTPKPALDPTPKPGSVAQREPDRAAVIRTTGAPRDADEPSICLAEDDTLLSSEDVGGGGDV